MVTEDWDDIEAYSRRFLARTIDTPEDLNDLDSDDRAFVVLLFCDASITNGGFAGLFTNPSGGLAGALPEAVLSFDLREHEAAATQALSVFDGPYPARFDERDAYWDQVLDFKPMAEWGAIAEQDLELLHRADTPAEAFESLRDHLVAHHIEPATAQETAAPGLAKTKG